MSSKSHESIILRGAFLPTFIVSIVAIAISIFTKGLNGFWGALLAQFIVILFFVIHIAVSSLTRNLNPILTMVLVLFSYFAKLFALGALLWLISNFTNQNTVDRTTFGLSAIALIIAWLWGEIASFLKLRLHLPLPRTPKE